MNEMDLIEQGRKAYGSNAWREAYECLSATHDRSPLEATDLELLSIAAFMIDKSEEGRRPQGAGA